MTRKRLLRVLGVLLLLFLAVPPLRWGCHMAQRRKAYQYLSALYGEHIAMDSYGRFLIQLEPGSSPTRLYIGHIDESQIVNDAGVTAEVTFVSAEDNILSLRYRNEMLEHASIAPACRSVEKWIAGDWYNVTYFYSSSSARYPLGFQQETIRTLQLCAEMDEETNLPSAYAKSAGSPLSIGLTRPDSGRYRLILPVYTQDPLDFYTDETQDHFYITAEFEIP